MFSTKDLLERHVNLRHSVESVIQDQLMVGCFVFQPHMKTAALTVI